MKKLIVASAILLSACVSMPTRVGYSLVSEVKEPEPTVRFESKYTSYSKTGEACGRNILGFYAFGDMTVEAAKRDGGITKVVSIEQRKKSMIFVSESCTVVKGY